MERIEISPNFTVEDIHKVREHNYEMTKGMSFEERKAYYKKGSDEMQKKILCFLNEEPINFPQF